MALFQFSEGQLKESIPDAASLFYFKTHVQTVPQTVCTSQAVASLFNF